MMCAYNLGIQENKRVMEEVEADNLLSFETHPPGHTVTGLVILLTKRLEVNPDNGEKKKQNILRTLQ